MDTDEKRRFIGELIANVEKDIIGKVPEMPKHWDGHELRRYIADRFEQTALTLRARGTEKAHLRRLHAYRNEVLIRNL